MGERDSFIQSFNHSCIHSLIQSPTYHIYSYIHSRMECAHMHTNRTRVEPDDDKGESPTRTIYTNTWKVQENIQLYIHITHTDTQHRDMIYGVIGWEVGLEKEWSRGEGGPRRGI